MVKKRQLKTNITRHPSSTEIEAFASQADDIIKKDESQSLNPNAPRKFKQLRIPFNEFEYNQLAAAAESTGRSKLSFIRWAISEMSK